MKKCSCEEDFEGDGLLCEKCVEKQKQSEYSTFKFAVGCNFDVVAKSYDEALKIADKHEPTHIELVDLN